MQVCSTPDSSTPVSIPLNEPVTTEFGKYVTFEVRHSAPKSQENPLAKLMAASKEIRQLTKKAPKDKKAELYNAVAAVISQNGGGWTVGMLAQGEKFVELLTSIIWTVSMPTLFSIVNYILV